MDTLSVIVTLVVVGTVLMLGCCVFILLELKKIHVLVNSRLSEALNRIDKLEKLLVNLGETVPQ